MGFWNIVLAVVIGAMFYRIGVNIATALVEKHKTVREETDVTCITLRIPYGDFNEEKIDINQFKSLTLDHETNDYVIKMKSMIGRLAVSKIKKIADEYGATSYSIEYIS